jgi:hypothetical protein
MAAPTQSEIQEQKLINEEYKIWKKNSLMLYNVIYTYDSSLQPNSAVLLPFQQGTNIW